MWAVPKIVFDFFRQRRRKQEEALINQAGKQDQVTSKKSVDKTVP
jgi:hypothetical protein